MSPLGTVPALTLEGATVAGAALLAQLEDGCSSAVELQRWLQNNRSVPLLERVSSDVQGGLIWG